MRAPTRSHGFDKPSDLEDELAQLDEELSDPELHPVKRTESASAGALDIESRSIQQQIDDLRDNVDAIRRDLEALQVGSRRKKREHGEIAAWLPMVRSVAVTSLAGRIFASSPAMALLVAAVPFFLGLSASSRA